MPDSYQTPVRDLSPKETSMPFRPNCPRILGTLGAVALLTAAFGERPAAAQEFQVHAEGAVAFWLDQPQIDRFDPGMYLALRPGVALGNMVTLQWSYALLQVPSGDSFSESGTAHFLTTGVRLRPLAPMQSESDQLGGLFVDADIGYVATGGLSRLGLDAGLGYAFQPSPVFSIGPVVRYVQVIQPDGIVDADPNDAQFLTVGVDLGFGRAHHEDEEMTCPDAPECPEVEPVEAAYTGCPDYDRDGVCDDDDRCPTEIGPPATLGCPIDPCSGDPLVVLVQFPYDSAELPAPRDEDPQTMDPVLDAIAAAIAQDDSCRVCIVGHASEEGAEDYNVELSRRRAGAVQKYLSARGLAGRDMPTTGMGASCQIVPETTRVLNRRVEFHRLQEGESCPVDCSE